MCNENNILCLETNFTFDEIVDCDEAFVTGTFGGIIPVKKLEQRQLKSTNDNSLVYRIRDLYNEKILNYLK